MSGYFIVYLSDESEPLLVGPFTSREKALEAYVQRLIDSGTDIEGASAVDLYLEDDYALIGRTV